MTSTNTKRKRNQTEATMSTGCPVKLSGKVAAIDFLLLIALLCVSLLYESAESVLIQTPKDAITIVNHSTVFNCSKSIDNSSSNVEELTWYHQPLGGVLTGVFEDGRIRDKYKDRFSIDKNVTSGRFNLLVERPETKDAGRYQCVENVLKLDTGASAELIVLDSNLVCESDNALDEIVGPTECAKPIAPDQLRLQCSVTYSGNLHPQMGWRKVDSKLKSHMTNCDIKGNRVYMCNTTLEANINMDGSEYICQIKTAKQYNCSLKVNKVIYAFSDPSVTAKTTTDEVVCSANTSKDLPCSYNWYKDNKTEHLGQTLKPNNSGQYRCEAECKIRSETCAFTAVVVDVSNTATSTSSSRNSKLLWLIVLLIIAVLVGAGTAGYCIWKKNRRAQLETVEADNQELMPNGRNNMDSDDAIENAYLKAPYIGKGLSGGEIHGPMQSKYGQCSCERITCTKDQQTQTNDGGVSKEDKICSLGREWMALDHTNLIKFYDVLRRPPSVYIMMEYAAGGSVRNALKKYTEHGVNLPIVKDWATQIASGMEYLHGEKIVHKHLSSTQILIMESVDIIKKNLKISQFCLVAEDFSSTHVDEKFSFTPPEVFDGNIVDKEVKKEGDVWGFGIIVWEILTNKQPYEDVKLLTKIIADIQQGAKLLEIPDSCPKELKRILTGCRSLVPAKRPSFSAILKRLQEWNVVTQQDE